VRSSTDWAGEQLRKNAALVTAVVNDPELARSVERWSADSLNTLSNVYTKALDGSYVDGLRPGAEYVSPLVHRLFGGHTPAEAWELACQALPNDRFNEEFVGCFFALGSDFASVTGLPLTTFSQEGFAKFSEYLQGLGLSQDWIIDALHQNAVELLAVALPSIGAVMAFSRKDQQQFARIVGSLGIAAIVSANPLAGLAMLIMAAVAFRRAKRADELSAAMKDAGQGAAIGGMAIAVSTIVGGPAIVGIVAAIAASIAVRQAVTKIPVAELADRVSMVTREDWQTWT
jgi:hypothetical protein